MKNYELKLCNNCNQMTNHLVSICQKCKNHIPDVGEKVGWREECIKEFGDIENPDLLHSYLEMRDLLNFISTIITQTVKEREEDILEKIRKSLLKKARQTDYADRT